MDDKTDKIPAIKCSICNGEQVAGFKNIHTGAFEEDMLILGEKDLKEFKKKYGITGEIQKIY
ncbi:MAG: aspartate dehydrogenase [Lachnospiraceae bacterium]|nr:aspartate dehydrogenase [Lachnospiraceae bacterium]